MPTIVIDKFDGRLTRYKEGEIESGYARYDTTFGNDPFTVPGNLTWFETPSQIDAAGSVITDLIVAAKPRLESGITYVYAIGHTGRLYKIQVNDPTTYNPNYDNPVLLTTLVAETPTFKFGSSIEFFGATQKIYIGHDKGVTSVNFDGTGEAFVGVAGSWTANVPRPMINFIGILRIGNGVNIAFIDSTATVTTYAGLSPALPVGTQIRDIDVSPDGNYAQIISSRVPQQDITVATQDTTSLSSGDSNFFLWNGIDAGVTSYNPFNSYSINSNISFGQYGYTLGYDLGGAAIYSGSEKLVSLPQSNTPNFNALFSTGNLLGFAAPEQDSSVLKGTLMTYGKYDLEVPEGLFRFFRVSAGTPETDIIQMPFCGIVSNLFLGASSSGYTGNQVGSAKVYFSTLETSSGPTTTYNLYKFTTVPTGLGSAIGGVYETQSQIFSEKVQIKQIRLYTEPLQTNNSFKIDLIGSSGGVMTNGSKTFTVGTNVTAGQDYVWWTPSADGTNTGAPAPSYVVGLRITNLGTKNWVGLKCELDYEMGGI